MSITTTAHAQPAFPVTHHHAPRVTDPSYATLAADRRDVRLHGTVAMMFVDVTPKDLSDIVAALTATWPRESTRVDAS
ncbi:hypothetical protein ACLQ2Q_08430 [Microbacterium sp. DT81.1]|uniref:hypothetical protein n=1 Tax=Microbacterium sp. DT81.1 TaxID=3393413 RepID=UPI003CEAB83A